MDGGADCYEPMFFLMSGNEPTDNYKNGLEHLRIKLGFKAAVKIAVATGDDAIKYFCRFTGNSEAMLMECIFEEFMKYIRDTIQIMAMY